MLKVMAKFVHISTAYIKKRRKLTNVTIAIK